MAASVLLALSSFAQNVGINADGARPNPNAILDIKSVNKGLLIPRMDSIAALRFRIQKDYWYMIFPQTTFGTIPVRNGNVYPMIRIGVREVTPGY